MPTFTNRTQLLALLDHHQRSVAASLFSLGRALGAIEVNGRVSVSVRLPLPSAGYAAITLFVVTHKRGGEVYTYWLDSWPKKIQAVRRRYERSLTDALGPRVIGHQPARHVSLAQAAVHMDEVREAVQRAVRAIELKEQQSALWAALDDTVAGLEGQPRKAMVRHRKREARLRAAKIRQVLGSGRRLACEVAACRFDFATNYGALGQGYIQVHHTKPLSTRQAPSLTKLSELRLVCPNCHAMIHKDHRCRTLAEVSRAIRQSGSSAA